MGFRTRLRIAGQFLALLLLGGLLSDWTPAVAQQLRLNDGRVLQGKFATITGVSDPAVKALGQTEEPTATPILIVDDALRRTFVPKLHLAEVLDQSVEQLVRIKLLQNVAQGGGAVSSVGPSLQIQPFDSYGRRIYKMQTRDGPLAVVQGITLLTPRYAKVEGLRGQPRPVVWDMRLATSSIPPERLRAILDRAISRDDPNARLEIVRFYLQAERFRDARHELEAIIRRFPEKQDLKAEVKQLRQMGAQLILREIELRKEAGQHELVKRLLDNFPADEVAGETLQQVREFTAQYERLDARLEHLRDVLGTIVAGISDPKQRQITKTTIDEILAQLNYENVDRLVAFEQLADDTELTPGQRAALAVSGWVVGSADATESLTLAVSLVTVRSAVRKYLREPVANERLALLDSIRSLQGASVELVARMIARMRPTSDLPEESAQGFGAYDLSAPGGEEGEFLYHVQLPAEYDPDRHYPTLVVLNGAYNSPLQELDFWAGSIPRDEQGKPSGPRFGQAMRHGAITLAVDWQKPQQYEYQYSAREHMAVLTCLRDACRRLSIDTDRVYLSGHGIGGDATWDMALAHPDLWAGAIPFVAQANETYVRHYWKNAEHVPFYFVAGELDGLKMSQNAPNLDKYLRKRFHTTVVEYLGRGHEPFHDEILRLFDWMGRYQRSSAPSEFECNTMRSWDNFFWWIECSDLPNTVHPLAWPERGARPTAVIGKRPAPNRLFAKTAAKKNTIWLSPELVDFAQPIRITLNGQKLAGKLGDVQPDLGVLLEDVRTRADRLHPFWAKIESP